MRCRIPTQSSETGFFYKPRTPYPVPHTRINKLKFLLSILILISPACIAQMPEDFPVVNPNDLPEAELTNMRSYSGSSLFGYMNGGADLYLEYGFSTLSVMDIVFMNGRYKTEIFKMNGPEEAFGIYSVSKFRCLDMPPLAGLTCRNRFQLQICKGPYYISIINGTGSASDSIASLKIGKIIADKITDKEIDLSDLLPGISYEEAKTQSLLVKGRLGIVNGSPDLEDFFSGISGYTALIVNQADRKTISVKFENDESCGKFLELNDLQNDKRSENRSVREISGSHLVIELMK